MLKHMMKFFKLKLKNGGFSLFEIILVISILFIIISFSTPKLSFVNKFLVKNEVDRLFTVFSFLQQRAISSNQDVTLIFDLKEKTYSYNSDFHKNKNKKGLDPRSQSGMTMKKGSRLEHVKYTLPDVVDFGFLQNVKGPPSCPGKKIQKCITFKKINENQFEATFFANGKISPGSIYFVDRGRNFLMSLTSPISQVSFIRKYKYEKGLWVCLDSNQI